jgi:hypothetical protein
MIEFDLDFDHKPMLFDVAQVACDGDSLDWVFLRHLPQMFSRRPQISLSSNFLHSNNPHLTTARSHVSDEPSLKACITKTLQMS